MLLPRRRGQEGDYGNLTCDSASHSVLDTRKVGELVIHLSSGPFEVGDMVHGELDWARRRQLMDHHTAVHIVGGAARRLLGLIFTKQVPTNRSNQHVLILLITED